MKRATRVESVSKV